MPPQPRIPGPIQPPRPGDKTPILFPVHLTGTTTYTPAGGSPVPAFTGFEVAGKSDGLTSRVDNARVLSAAQPGVFLDGFDPGAVSTGNPALALARLAPGAGGRYWELAPLGTGDSPAAVARNCLQKLASLTKYDCLTATVSGGVGVCAGTGGASLQLFPTDPTATAWASDDTFETALGATKLRFALSASGAPSMTAVGEAGGSGPAVTVPLTYLGCGADKCALFWAPPSLCDGYPTKACSFAPAGAPRRYTLTAAGGSGAYAVFNGSWTATHSGGCTWAGTSGGVTLTVTWVDAGGGDRRVEATLASGGVTVKWVGPTVAYTAASTGCTDLGLTYDSTTGTVGESDVAPTPGLAALGPCVYQRCSDNGFLVTVCCGGDACDVQMGCDGNIVNMPRSLCLTLSNPTGYYAGSTFTQATLEYGTLPPGVTSMGDPARVVYWSGLTTVSPPPELNGGVPFQMWLILFSDNFGYGRGSQCIWKLYWQTVAAGPTNNIRDFVTTGDLASAPPAPPFGYPAYTYSPGTPGMSTWAVDVSLSDGTGGCDAGSDGTGCTVDGLTPVLAIPDGPLSTGSPFTADGPWTLDTSGSPPQWHTTFTLADRTLTAYYTHRATAGIDNGQADLVDPTPGTTYGGHYTTGITCGPPVTWSFPSADWGATGPVTVTT